MVDLQSESLLKLKGRCWLKSLIGCIQAPPPIKHMLHSGVIPKIQFDSERECESWPLHDIGTQVCITTYRSSPRRNEARRSRARRCRQPNHSRVRPHQRTHRSAPDLFARRRPDPSRLLAVPPVVLHHHGVLPQRALARRRRRGPLGRALVRPRPLAHPRRLCVGPRRQGPAGCPSETTPRLQPPGIDPLRRLGAGARAMGLRELRNRNARAAGRASPERWAACSVRAFAVLLCKRRRSGVLRIQERPGPIPGRPAAPNRTGRRAPTRCARGGRCRMGRARQAGSRGNGHGSRGSAAMLRPVPPRREPAHACVAGQAGRGPAPILGRFGPTLLLPGLRRPLHPRGDAAPGPPPAVRLPSRPCAGGPPAGRLSEGAHPLRPGGGLGGGRPVGRERPSRGVPELLQERKAMGVTRAPARWSRAVRDAAASRGVDAAQRADDARPAHVRGGALPPGRVRERQPAASRPGPRMSLYILVPAPVPVGPGGPGGVESWSGRLVRSLARYHITSKSVMTSLQ